MKIENTVGAGYATACYNCCTALIWLILIAEQGEKILLDASTKLVIDTSQLNQVVLDWETVPFTDIRITDEWTCHDLEHPHGKLDLNLGNATHSTKSIDKEQGEWSEVFTRVWYGLEFGCNCVGVYGPSHFDMEDFNGKFTPGVSCTPEMMSVGCGLVNPHPPVF